MNWTVEPGKFEVRIGSSSTDIRLKKEFTILP
jgi:beta-glucosidase